MSPDDREADLRPRITLPAETGPASMPAKRAPMPLASKILLAIILLVILAFLIPGLGWVVGHIIVPMWHEAFAWL